MTEQSNCIQKSGEDYLEAILILSKKQLTVRSVDLAEFFEYSKPSVSRAVSILKNGGFLTMDESGFLRLTDIGSEVAVKIYERHQFFRDKLIEAGVAPEKAEKEGCQMEHTISEDSFQKLKKYTEKSKKN